ncbi:MAG TPA: phosphoglucosamine mutase [Streptosporangiaceae bacterium]|nr:phosphoglucosamine mutase [Streptosporangiaceae bacterium]
MGRLFGTDGVRGVAGDDLTARLAMDLAAAAAEVLQTMHGGGAPQPREGRPVAVVGRDPRASGEFLEAAVVAGLAGVGVDVLRLGVIPTPGVAYLTGALGADLGVMLSASHNPARDNGIKLFARGGFKLPDEAEDAIEARMADSNGQASAPLPGGFGRVSDAAAQRERYLTHLLGSLSGHSNGRPNGVLPLAGLRVVVDCAHGAASELAPEMLRRAGAEVISIGAEPDGHNINDGCGSTHLESLVATVLGYRADAGIAHDGDADRCLAVDADGQVVDGDQILAALALGLKRANRLTRDTVVATVMSNLGFRLAMEAAGITLVETAVGDRYVLEAMRAGQYVLGGEQSGHIIMLDHASTGDGLLTALHLLAAVARDRVPLAELASVMTRYPQVLVNVTGVDKARVTQSAALATEVESAQAELGGSGRVLVRPSGTEPAVRVMVEAMDHERAQRVADRLVAAVQSVS